MNYQQTLIQSTRHLKLTQPRMQYLGIPSTPENFTVWYEYSLGSNLELNSAIDDHLNRGDDFTNTVNRDLYLRFVAVDDQRQSSDINNEIDRTLRSLQAEVLGMHSDMGAYQQSLTRCNDQLKNDEAPIDVGEVISNLTCQTDEMNDTNLATSKKLQILERELKGLKQTFERIRLNIHRDEMTGISNRRSFERVLDQQLEYADISDQPFSVLMIDIDNFKSFNDNYGHLLGDKVVRYVADKICNCIKGQDVVARYSGDEFVVLLPETDMDGGQTVADRVSRGVTKQSIHSGHEEEFSLITLSVGVATYRLGESGSELIDRAEQALFFSKRNGRNCVSTESAFLEQYSLG